MHQIVEVFRCLDVNSQRQNLDICERRVNNIFDRFTIPCLMATSLYLTAHNWPNRLDFSGPVFAASFQHLTQRMAVDNEGTMKVLSTIMLMPKHGLFFKLVQTKLVFLIFKLHLILTGLLNAFTKNNKTLESASICQENNLLFLM